MFVDVYMINESEVKGLISDRLTTVVDYLI